MRLVIAVAVTALGAVMCQVKGQDEPARTLKQDRQMLKGNWRTKEWRKPDAKGWQCSIQVAVEEDADDPEFSLTINLEHPEKTTGPVLGSPVQHRETGGKRWIVIDPKLAKRNMLPTEIYYRFDGDSLLLKLPDGECKGEYRLMRPKK